MFSAAANWSVIKVERGASQESLKKRKKKTLAEFNCIDWFTLRMGKEESEGKPLQGSRVDQQPLNWC